MQRQRALIYGSANDCNGKDNFRKTTENDVDRFNGISEFTPNLLSVMDFSWLSTPHRRSGGMRCHQNLWLLHPGILNRTIPNHSSDTTVRPSALQSLCHIGGWLVYDPYKRHQHSADMLLMWYGTACSRLSVKFDPETSRSAFGGFVRHFDCWGSKESERVGKSFPGIARERRCKTRGLVCLHMLPPDDYESTQP